jgi:hypothetical protein
MTRYHARTAICVLVALWLAAGAAAAAPIHTTYLWHMHQPIYWPDASTWYADPYEHAYGRLLPSGIYFVRLVTGRESAEGKLVLLR